MKVIYSVFLSIMCLFLIEHNLEIDCSPTLTPTEDDTLVLVHVVSRNYSLCNKKYSCLSFSDMETEHQTEWKNCTLLIHI